MTASNRKGLLRGVLDAMVQARTRQAARYVNGYLLTLDDETLKAHGYDRASLKKHRYQTPVH